MSRPKVLNSIVSSIAFFSTVWGSLSTAYAGEKIPAIYVDGLRLKNPSLTARNSFEYFPHELKYEGYNPKTGAKGDLEPGLRGMALPADLACVEKQLKEMQPLPDVEEIHINVASGSRARMDKVKPVDFKVDRYNSTWDGLTGKKGKIKKVSMTVTPIMDKSMNCKPVKAAFLDKDYELLAMLKTQEALKDLQGSNDHPTPFIVKERTEKQMHPYGEDGPRYGNDSPESSTKAYLRAHSAD